MWNLAHGEHLREQLGYFHGCGADEGGASAVAHQLNFLDYGIVFLARSLIHAVVLVVAYHRTIGGNLYHVKLIDVPELACLGRCGTGHTSQLVIHTEVILQRDGGKCLRCSFHFYVLLGFNGLMQTIAPAATFHDTARLLVNNLYLAVDNHILVVLVEHAVGFE